MIAGTNGAGKSSIAGAMLWQEGVEHFDPDEATRLARNPEATAHEANSAAWHEGRRLLERAIAERLSFALETTLGGATITALAERALSSGCRSASGTSVFSAPSFTSGAFVRASREADTTCRKRRSGNGTTADG